MGDFNAEIGADNKGYEEIMGTHGIGQMNENGERFADLCALNQMVIGGSIFPHKNIHKVTWRSPDHTTENQIDHICFVKRFRRSFQDVRVMRDADVSSDHHMIMTTLKLKLKKYPATNAVRKRYNVKTLQNKDVQGKFQISIAFRFSALRDIIENETDIEKHWQHTKIVDMKRANKLWGKRKATTKSGSLLRQFRS
ncbi:craniofacial development protein 2 [Elysia marginata]|uniref:Craniofacial development protein 2 n=1 Tax=Elysia marginata TaxID=1093978 RepID=A0AAV4HQ55_9GAST|nr:craniofacial development protein 2 [Elysia marginata]